MDNVTGLPDSMMQSNTAYMQCIMPLRSSVFVETLVCGALVLHHIILSQQFLFCPPLVWQRSCVGSHSHTRQLCTYPANVSWSLVCIDSHLFASCDCQHVSLCNCEAHKAHCICLMTPVAMETDSCFTVTRERKRREWLKGSGGQRFTVYVCVSGSGTTTINIKCNIT